MTAPRHGRRIAAAIGTLSIAALTVSACSGTGDQPEGGGSDDPIVIGISLPLTGDFSEPGKGVERGYEAWRDDRAREHYEWSFDFARFPKPEVAGPVFAGIAEDPEAGQNLRDALSRQLRPRSDVFTDERLGQWFATEGAPVSN